MQADLFEYLCLEAQQHRRDVELNALEPQVGSDPLTPPQLAQIQEARKQHQQQAAANQRQAAVHRQGPMCTGLCCNCQHCSRCFIQFMLADDPNLGQHQAAMHKHKVACLHVTSAASLHLLVASTSEAKVLCRASL